MVTFTSKWPELRVIVRPMKIRVADTGEREFMPGREIQFSNHMLQVPEDDAEVLNRLRSMTEYGSTVIEQEAQVEKPARPRKEA